MLIVQHASPFHGHVFDLEGEEKFEALRKHLNESHAT